MATQQPIPYEVWLNVTRQFQDRKSAKELGYLWTTVRLVNRAFKEGIENIFQNVHLPSTWLHTDNLSIAKCGLDLDVFIHHEMPLDRFTHEFTLSHFAEGNPSRAIFKAGPSHFKLPPLFALRGNWDTGETLRPYLFHDKLREVPSYLPHWAEHISEQQRKLNIINYRKTFVVQVRDGFNDNVIPGMQIDFLNEEISFDWKEMFSAFFHKSIFAKRTECPVTQPTAVPMLPKDDSFLWSKLQFVEPALRPLAVQDYQDYVAIGNMVYKKMVQSGRAFKAVDLWCQVVDRLTRTDKSATAVQKAKFGANLLTSLDKEGFVDITEHLLALNDIHKRRELKRIKTEGCDNCRSRNQYCDIQLAQCVYCFKHGTDCTYSLARWNTHPAADALSNGRLKPWRPDPTYFNTQHLIGSLPPLNHAVPYIRIPHIVQCHIWLQGPNADEDLRHFIKRMKKNLGPEALQKYRKGRQMQKEQAERARLQFLQQDEGRDHEHNQSSLVTTDDKSTSLIPTHDPNTSTAPGVSPSSSQEPAISNPPKRKRRDSIDLNRRNLRIQRLS